MTQNISVKCELNRCWTPLLAEREGEFVNGTLIDISTEQKAENNRLIPVGIVILDGGTFHSVPMDFIQQI